MICIIKGNFYRNNNKNNNMSKISVLAQMCIQFTIF